jgi:hypothetical protein
MRLNTLFLAGLRALLLLVVLFSPIAHARGEVMRFVSQWTTACEGKSGPLWFEFKSISGDPTNDDMTISVRRGVMDRAPVPISSALFIQGKLKSNVVSVCDKVTGVSMRSGHLLVLVQKDDRPLSDQMVALLIAPISGAVLDVVPDLGAIALDTEFRESENSLQIRLIRPTRGASENGEWMSISEVGDRLKIKWDRK